MRLKPCGFRFGASQCGQGTGAVGSGFRILGFMLRTRCWDLRGDDVQVLSLAGAKGFRVRLLPPATPDIKYWFKVLQCRERPCVFRTCLLLGAEGGKY